MVVGVATLREPVLGAALMLAARARRRCTWYAFRVAGHELEQRRAVVRRAAGSPLRRGSGPHGGAGARPRPARPRTSAGLYAAPPRCSAAAAERLDAGGGGGLHAPRPAAHPPGDHRAARAAPASAAPVLIDTRCCGRAPPGAADHRPVRAERGGARGVGLNWTPSSAPTRPRALAAGEPATAPSRRPAWTAAAAQAAAEPSLQRFWRGAACSRRSPRPARASRARSPRRRAGVGRRPAGAGNPRPQRRRACCWAALAEGALRAARCSVLVIPAASSPPRRAAPALEARAAGAAS